MFHDIEIDYRASTTYRRFSPLYSYYLLLGIAGTLMVGDFEWGEVCFNLDR